MGQNIKEEIERIKSLFTEERLYGNLVKEQVTNPDEDGNFVIDAAEFTASGSDITADEAKLFVQSYQTAHPTQNTEVGHCINQQVIQKLIGTTNNPGPAKTLVSGSLNYGITSQGGLCYLYANNTKTNPVPAGYAAQITKIEFWQNDWVTFYITLRAPIDLSTQSGYTKTFNNSWDGSANGATDVERRVGLNSFANRTEKIKYLQFKAPIDVNTMKYKQITFMNFYDEDGNKKNLMTLLQQFEEGNPYGGYKAGDGTGSSWIFSAGVSLDGLISKPKGLDINPAGGDIKDLVDSIER